MKSAPLPLAAGELDVMLARLEEGTPFKAALEELLLELSPERAEGLMLYMREARAAWLPLLRSCGGRALLIGNAFSGTAHALAAAGFRPTLYDPSPERMRFEAARCLALTGVSLELVEAADAKRLPFEADSFELVVQEDGLPGTGSVWGHGASELRRVARGEVVVIADNRLGYKRSLGARGKFAVPSPVQYVLDVVSSRRGRHTLAGYRRALNFEDSALPRALSLYPHSLDFTYVVGLDGAGPKLHIGPMERRNKLKIAAHKLGLFPLLTPSFAIISSSRELSAHPLRIDRVLSELSEHLDEPTPVVEEIVATRGNTAVVQTCVPGADPALEAGRWSLHIPLSAQQEEQIGRHHETIEQLWSRDAVVPVPEPLYRGRLSGLSFSCERRLPGLTAPQLSNDAACVERTLQDVVRHFAQLVSQPPRPIDEQLFEQHFQARFDLVSKFCGRSETRRNLAKLCDETRERVLGHATPLVLYHADLRSKHIQVDESGRVLGYLDWGSSVADDLPYSDLLQFLVHQLKQARSCSAKEAWGLFLAGDDALSREHELLAHYATTLGLAPEVCRALEACFPVFVAAMAEANWDYSRPRWLHAQFGV